MKIVSWNVYDEATQELRFIPEGTKKRNRGWFV